eukprot:CAMPEP_0184861918 /NCGR_PEP_ID=MMETSP0580-20130426/6504_1 /TAXON_ID=1118495 /ORGANISM="Dactyliosolen fragilissimus" /LENGTH=168 /DNA_ID=CAMNT_0027359599 /DNA_START=119 /DNA_END=623 /DNA_ORIENTATION=-
MDQGIDNQMGQFTTIGSNDMDYFLIEDVIPNALLVLVAVLLGLAGQKLLNSMMEGDQGLGAFLSDGSGYNKSGFRDLKGNVEYDTSKDPLPWLRLPKFDYVDVAGQEVYDQINEDIELGMLEKLEGLQERLKSELSVGDYEKATVTKQELETYMKENGFQFKEAFNDN